MREEVKGVNVYSLFIRWIRAFIFRVVCLVDYNTLPRKIGERSRYDETQS